MCIRDRDRVETAVEALNVSVNELLKKNAMKERANDVFEICSYAVSYTHLPSDDVEARAAVRAAYEYVGPVYLRFGRLAVPVINDLSLIHI